MSSDLDVIERLRTDPAPAMAVDLTRVTVLGRRRLHQRTVRWVAVVAAAAVAATVATVLALAPGDRHSTTPPAGTSTTAPDLSIAGNGGAVLPDDHGTYNLWLVGGTITLQVTRDGKKGDMPSTVVLPSGGTWLQTLGTQHVPVLVGVVPAGATDVDIVPAPGTPSHTVQTAPAGDFEAFVVRFDHPPGDGQLTAVDLQWRLGGALHTALGTGPEQVEFNVSGAGRLAVTMSSPRASSVTATLDGALLSPAPVVGNTPGSRYSLGKHQLPDGRVLLWGVVPQQTFSVIPVLEGSATASGAGMRPLGAHSAYLAYAAIVEGRPMDVTGLRTSDRSGTGIGYVE